MRQQLPGGWGGGFHPLQTWALILNTYTYTGLQAPRPPPLNPLQRPREDQELRLGIRESATTEASRQAQETKTDVYTLNDGISQCQ